MRLIKVSTGVIAITMLLFSGSPAQAQSSSQSNSSPEGICKSLEQSLRNGDLPKGFRRPQISLLEMNSKERAAGMVCKISITAQGGSPFGAIRYRVFRNPAAA